jgi:hypothetical protein
MSHREEFTVETLDPKALELWPHPFPMPVLNCKYVVRQRGKIVGRFLNEESAETEAQRLRDEAAFVRSMSHAEDLTAKRHELGLAWFNDQTMPVPMLRTFDDPT